LRRGEGQAPGIKQNGDPGQNNGKRGLRRDKGESAAHHVHRQLFGSEYTQILIRLIADAIPLVERNTGRTWNEDPRVLERVLHAVRLIAHATDLVGTDPDERPDDDQLDALKKAVPKPATQGEITASSVPKNALDSSLKDV
jgi:hypothetical protein